MNGSQAPWTDAASATDALERIASMEARASTTDVPSGDGHIRWRRFGAGEPMVLLHGGHGSWLHWLRNIEALSQRHTVWVPDMPGFHDSTALPVDGPVDRQLMACADALALTLDILVGTETPVDLVGFSFGGMVAAQLAVRRHGIRRMVLLGAVGHGMARRQLAPMRNWRLDEPGNVAATMRHNLGAQMLHDVRRIDALAVEIHTRSCVQTRFRSKAISRANGLQALLDALDQPILMLWGEHDVTAAIPPDVAETLRSGRAERAWCLIPGAGHWAQYERAADVNSLLLGWFDPARR